MLKVKNWKLSDLLEDGFLGHPSAVSYSCFKQELCPHSGSFHPPEEGLGRGERCTFILKRGSRDCEGAGGKGELARGVLTSLRKELRIWKSYTIALKVFRPRAPKKVFAHTLTGSEDHRGGDLPRSTGRSGLSTASGRALQVTACIKRDDSEKLRAALCRP